jgi:hypothetical protein
MKAPAGREASQNRADRCRVSQARSPIIRILKVVGESGTPTQRRSPRQPRTEAGSLDARDRVARGSAKAMVVAEAMGPGHRGQRTKRIADPQATVLCQSRIETTRQLA